MTRDRDTAAEWLKVFEGAGLDGVVAKPEKSAYLPGKRAMIKIKHARTADCVVAGFRWYKTDPTVVGSLLLGLYDEQGVLQHVGVTSSFTMKARKELAAELGVGLGDRLTWDVQGVPLETRIASLRRVTWARFQPNFFAVFEPGVL